MIKKTFWVNRGESQDIEITISMNEWYNSREEIVSRAWTGAKSILKVTMTETVMASSQKDGHVDFVVEEFTP